MKFFSKLLSEAESTAAVEAHKLGLVYHGNGYWKNAQTGKIDHKTKNGKLVPIHKNNNSMGDDPATPEQLAGIEDENNLQSPSFNLAGGLGSNVGPPPEPDNEDLGWDPGPDGDHCVGDEEPEDIPLDAYVGASNSADWTAGPDGSNFANKSLEDSIQEAINLLFEEEKTDFEASVRKHRIARNVRKINSADVTGGAVTRDEIEKGRKQKKNQRNARIVRNANKTNSADMTGGAKTKEEAKNVRDWGKELFPEKKPAGPGPLKQKAVKMVAGISPTNAGKTDLEAISALRKIPANDVDKYLDTIDDIEKRGDIHTGIKKEKVRHRNLKLGAEGRDAEKVKEMNEKLRGMLVNPNYDMTPDENDMLGQGSFGAVYKSKDGQNVIKRGEIGENELRALTRMKDNPGFPTLINAQYETPFNHKSSVENNPLNDPHQRAALSNGKYFQPDPNDNWNDLNSPYATAQGTFAMSKAKGYPWSRTKDSLSSYEVAAAREKLWKLRGQLHKAGLSHNDMHDGNIYHDPDTGEMSILDLGLANHHPISALMEATAGLSKDNNDYQLTQLMRRNKMHPGLEEKVEMNMNALEETLNDYGIDPDIAEKILSGGIRMNKQELDEIQDYLDENDIDPMELIQNLYKGIADDDEDGIPNALDPDYKGPKVKNPQNVGALQRRMANAMNNQDVLRNANNVRKGKGKSPLKYNAIATRAFDMDDEYHPTGRIIEEKKVMTFSTFETLCEARKGLAAAASDILSQLKKETSKANAINDLESEIDHNLTDFDKLTQKAQNMINAARPKRKAKGAEYDKQNASETQFDNPKAEIEAQTRLGTPEAMAAGSEVAKLAEIPDTLKKQRADRDAARAAIDPKVTPGTTAAQEGNSLIAIFNAVAKGKSTKTGGQADINLAKDLLHNNPAMADKKATDKKWYESHLAQAARLREYLELKDDEIDDTYVYERYGEGENEAIGKDNQHNLMSFIWNDIFGDAQRRVYGTDKVGSKDSWMPADISIAKKESIPKIIENLQEIKKDFETETNPGIMIGVINNYMRKLMANREFIPISLKQGDLEKGIDVEGKEANQEGSRYYDPETGELLPTEASFEKSIRTPLDIIRDQDTGEMGFSGNSLVMHPRLRVGDQEMPFSLESKPASLANDATEIRDYRIRPDKGTLAAANARGGSIPVSDMGKIVKKFTGDDLNARLGMVTPEGKKQAVITKFDESDVDYWTGVLDDLVADDAGLDFDFGDLGKIDGEAAKDTKEYFTKLLLGMANTGLHTSTDGKETKVEEKFKIALRGKLRHLKVLQAIRNAKREDRIGELIAQKYFKAAKMNVDGDLMQGPFLKLQ